MSPACIYIYIHVYICTTYYMMCSYYMNDVFLCLHQYPGLEDMMADVELLVNNAMTFNEEDSTVYQVSSDLLRYTYTRVIEG